VLIDRGQVRLITHLAASRRIAEVELTGDFEAVGVGDLLARLPHLGVSPRRVRGSLAGRCLLRLSTDVQRVHVSGDLTDLEVRLGEIFVKPLGRRLKTTVDFLSDRRMPSWQRNFLRWRWLDPQADLRTEVAFGPGPDGPQARWSCRAEVKDARWLLDTLPQLPKALAGGRLSGAANLLAEGTWRPGRLWADLCCDADALEYVSGDSHRRSKRPGVPLRIRLAGQLARRAAAPVAVEVDALALDLGGSHVRLAGRAQVALDAEGRPPAADLSHPRGWAAAGLRQFEAKLTGLIAFDPALAALFPEVGDLGRRHGLDGSAEVDANIRADENEATLWGHIDADRLAFRLAEGVSKPVGLPARAALAARAPADLSRFHVSNLQLRAGDVHLLAGGSLQLRSPTDRGWDVDLVDLHLAAWTRRADTLVRLAEGLGPYRLKGDAIIEAEWTNHHGGYLRYVSVGAESLRGYYRGKTAVVSGRLLLGDLRRNTQGRWKVGRLRTDGLELQAGKNHLWLIADLSQLADSLTGDVHLLAEYIDQRDLIRWLAKPKGDAVEARAAEMVGRYKATLCRSRLRGTVKINHLRTWNAGVSHYYDVRNILVDASLDRGAVTVAYTNGLNGGTVRGSIEVELAEESPIVALRRELKDLAAKENIQPQLALFFPGNTVYGFFNRRSDMRVPLVNLLANAIDFRVPLRPVGTAKTVTIDGMTQGRAAPTFVTRLFPGLNLAKYRYRKMTSFSEFLADGSVSNDMIFDGHTYDLYIMGDTDAQNIGRYTVGLILIGNPQPAEWNHTWRLGRLPIFNLKARIEGGQLHDVEVVYPWPNESLGEIFLRNNILYRAFLASRKK
ncbi:MAG: hypothetical protein QF792_05250, partial [Phycisphaerae bacterium]|nr:hypothetical protein [Phycisphaerae bacterium]